MPVRVADEGHTPLNAPGKHRSSSIERTVLFESPQATAEVGAGTRHRVDALRKRLRNFLDRLIVEFVVIAIVLIYMVLILIDLMLQGDESDENSWGTTFKFIDLAFLCFFTLELGVRLFAYGPRFLYSFLNLFDALIVIISLILQVYWIADPTGLGTKPAFLSTLRMVRLLRLFVVMNKVQKTRAAYKKTLYLKDGPPVERVMHVLHELKTRAETDDMAADIDWVIGLIASEKLYSIDLRAEGKVDKEMSEYLINTMGMQKDTTDAEQRGSEVEPEMSGLSPLQAESGFVVQGGSRELRLIEEVSAVPGASDLFDRMHKWDVDPFELHRVCAGSGLVVVTYRLIEEAGLVDKFQISQHRLLVYLRAIQEGYSMSNAYHNSIHVLDVVLNTHYFISQESIAQLLTPLDQLAVLLAAVMHDFEHPGVNNNFLMATKHKFAITYNDQSILESHHVASAWALLLQDDYNFLFALKKEQYAQLRDTVIQAVVGTDMKYHFEHVTKFKTKMGSDAFQPGCDQADVKFLLTAVLHTADISNPAKPQELCLRWTESVMEEFFRQGDREAQLGLPISPFYNRETTSTAQCQIGFINVIVKPLFTEVCAFLGGPAITDCMGALLANLEAWEKSGDELLKSRKPRTMPPVAHELSKRCNSAAALPISSKG